MLAKHIAILPGQVVILDRQNRVTCVSSDRFEKEYEKTWKLLSAFHGIFYATDEGKQVVCRLMTADRFV